MIRALRGRIKRPRPTLEIFRYIIEGEEKDDEILGEVLIPYKGKLRRVKGSWPGEETPEFRVECFTGETMHWSFVADADKVRTGRLVYLMDIPAESSIRVKGKAKNFSVHVEVESME